jgi:hypothetical protein
MNGRTRSMLGIFAAMAAGMAGPGTGYSYLGEEEKMMFKSHEELKEAERQRLIARGFEEFNTGKYMILARSRKQLQKKIDKIKSLKEEELPSFLMKSSTVRIYPQ